MEPRPDSPEPDLPTCLNCGTCCFSQLDRYVEVSGDDYERLADAAEQCTTFIGNRAYMRMAEGHCGALVIEPQTRQFVCQVYESRPQTCRDLERGSLQCLGERDTKAGRPVRALRLVLAELDAPAALSCAKQR